MRCLLALFLCATLWSQTPRFTDPDRRAKLATTFPEIEKIFERYMKQRNIPGLVFGIVIDGELAHIKALGVRDVESKDPVTPDTVFRIASMTKSFTALALLKLRDEGKLSFDDPVSKWIPEFSDRNYPTKDSAPVRVRQLLTHGVGLPEDNPWGDQQLGVSDATLTAWLKKGTPYSTPPDTAFEYSNYGFALAGRVIERASKRSYRDYLEKEILAPLGMKASTLEPSAVAANARALGYRYEDKVYKLEPSLPHGAFGAMGGLLTSANDLARYVAYQLAAWPPRDDPERGPVRRSSVREMQRVWRTSGLNVMRMGEGPIQASAVGYGYGLGIMHDCRFSHAVSHGGGLPGFGSNMAWLPEYGVGLFAMANLTYTGPSQPIQQSLDLMTKTGALQPRKLPASPALLKARAGIVALWQKWDDATAEALAADNLFKDTSAQNRRAQIEGLKSRLGACRAPGDVEPENMLRGKFRMDCEKGNAEAIFTLAPTNPPTVQYLRFNVVSHLTDTAKQAAESAAAQAPKAVYGTCKVGQPLGGNGVTDFRVALDCDKAPVDALVRADASGKALNVLFLKPASATCPQ